MNLHGAKFEEIIGIINHIASQSTEEDWTRNGKYLSGQLVCQGSIFGINLRLRHFYHDKGLGSVSLTGKGWMIHFNVTKQRPRTMPQEVQSEMVDIVLAPFKAIDSLNHTAACRTASYTRRSDAKIKMCLHGGSIVSPEEFRKEMTILRMFSSEWEL